MSRLTWDAVGERFFETGVDRGVLYVGNEAGVAWTGLTSIVERPSGGDAQGYYLDGIKYLNVPGAEEFQATITAYTYPNEFAPCEGNARVYAGMFITHQPRVPFGLTYRTKIGDDLTGVDSGYKVHIVYNALAAPSTKAYSSLDDSSDPTDFSWDITTRPPAMIGYKRTSHVIIDSRYANPEAISLIEDFLYGSDSNAPGIPTLIELLDIFETSAVLTVVDNGDGTFTVTGPDEAIIMLDSDTFEITWPSALVIDEDRFSISSL